MPAVSVIIPVYNTAAYLPRCLDSVCNQTLKDIEIICVDDGSTDGSAEIVDEYAARDSRIRVFHQANAGQATARNCGLDHATGEYIMFCDSDDRYEPTMCARMTETIQREGVDLVQCQNSWVVDADVPESEAAFRCRDTHFCLSRGAGKVKMDEDAILGNNVLIWQRIFRRDLVVRFGIRFPDGHETDDDAFCFQYGMVSREMYYLPEALYVYTVRRSSVMGNYFRMTPRNREDAVFSAAWTVDFALRNGMASARVGLLQEIVGYHYRTCRDFYAPAERPALLVKFNSLLVRLPGPRKRIVDAGGRVVLITLSAFRREG